jgi:hypothetical protein
MNVLGHGKIKTERSFGGSGGGEGGEDPKERARRERQMSKMDADIVASDNSISTQREDWCVRFVSWCALPDHSLATEEPPHLPGCDALRSAGAQA